ncbi:MAG: hypothetical protein QOC76_4761 [Mycobacterium sp.]|jgi:hypothetical protein|nr:hypothetical protein [Mycobacterium sp.]
MSRSIPAKRPPLIAAAALVAGLVAVPVPAAYAAPPSGCTFPAVVNINISDGSSMSFAANGANVDGPTTIGPPGGEGTPGALQGGIAPNGHVELTFIHGANDERHYGGDVGEDGRATGSVAGTPLTWATGGPLTCTTAATVAGPDVVGEPVISGIIIHVTDHSGKTSKCHYDSEFYDRDFTLNANSTADVKLIPAVPLLRAWPVTVTCDNGAKTETSIDY